MRFVAYNDSGHILGLETRPKKAIAIERRVHFYDFYHRDGMALAAIIQSLPCLPETIRDEVEVVAAGTSRDDHALVVRKLREGLRRPRVAHLV